MANQEGINISNPAVDPGVDERLQTKSIADTLGKIEECRAFADWVRKSGLDVLLSRTGLHTLFAVQDSAFQAPESGRPEEFLNRQLLNGASQTFDLSRCKQVKTASGEIFPVSEGGGRVGSARIVHGDIACTNGTIHVVDAELQAAADRASA